MPRRLGRSWAANTAALDPSVPTLFTIGYSGHSPGSFASALKEAGVERVLDVRSRPFSRKPGFSKGPLSASLHEAGFEYVPLPALGAPAAILDEKRAGAAFADVEPAYRAHLSKQKGPTEEAARLARERPSALMCLEKDPTDCHRGILAEKMAKLGFRIVHLQKARAAGVGGACDHGQQLCPRNVLTPLSRCRRTPRRRKRGLGSGRGTTKRRPPRHSSRYGMPRNGHARP